MAQLDTKFSDMPIGVRVRWVAWANTHDWGGTDPAHYDEATGKIVCTGAIHDGTQWDIETVSFNTPREMRDWAGY